MNHINSYLKDIVLIAQSVDNNIIENMVSALAELRSRKGRLFILGVGGSAANASHAVNDFRKLCNIQSYAPTDNISELTARTNDDGWDSVFKEWLITSCLSENDALLILSVGGGDAEHNTSVNLVRALEEGKARKSMILGIVGREGGYTKKIGDHVLVIPTVNPLHVTPLTEAFQAVVWHCLVSHPTLQTAPTKW
jgi:D-sedoheptulose 7-phosphate isomerase